jgi:hypothetical protein
MGAIASMLGGPVLGGGIAEQEGQVEAGVTEGVQLPEGRVEELLALEAHLKFQLKSAFEGSPFLHGLEGIVGKGPSVSCREG